MKEDITIVCLCGEPFTFTAGEQEFYEKKGFQTPKRCPDCRAKKRQERSPFPNDRDR